MLEPFGDVLEMTRCNGEKERLLISVQRAFSCL